MPNNWAKFDGSQPTLPKYLREAGYETAMIGKWHLHTDPTGFDHWQVLPGQGAYFNPDFLTPDGKIRRPGYVTRVVTDDAITWLREGRDPDKPFYLQIGHKAPHSQWEPEEKYAGLFDGREMPEPDTLHEDLSHRSPSFQHVETTLDPDGIGQYEKGFYNRHKADMPEGMDGKATRSWIYQKYVKDYLRTVASVDEQMGRLLDYLDESGLGENTLVLFTSDQGYYLGEHGLYSKHLMYEESFSTPLLMRYPAAIQPGTVVEDLAMNIDFAPTILDFAGAAIPDDMQGVSLRPVFEAGSELDRDAVYYRYYHPGWGHTAHEGVRTDRYKLIRFMHPKEAPRQVYWELYDLQEDPDEMNNIYDTASPELKQTLTRKLIELRRQYQVPEDNSDLLFNMGPKVPPLDGQAIEPQAAVPPKAAPMPTVVEPAVAKPATDVCQSSVLSNDFDSVDKGRYDAGAGAAFRFGGGDEKVLLGNATGNQDIDVFETGGAGNSGYARSVGTAVRSRSTVSIFKGADFSVCFQFEPAAGSNLGAFASGGFALPVGLDGSGFFAEQEDSRMMLGLALLERGEGIGTARFASMGKFQAYTELSAEDISLTDGHWYQLDFDLRFDPALGDWVTGGMTLTDRGMDGTDAGRVVGTFGASRIPPRNGTALNDAAEAYVVVVMNSARGARKMDNLSVKMRP